MFRVRTLLKRKMFWGGSIIVLAVGGFIFSKESVSTYEFVHVDRGDVRRFVDVTGGVQPIDYADVSFEQPGRVARVFVLSGQSVYKGQVLAQLSNADVQADVSAAQARYSAEVVRVDQLKSQIESAQLRLDELTAGARPEEIAIKRSALATASLDFGKTIVDTAAVSADALQDVSYVIDVLLAPLFYGQQGMSFDLTYQTCDVQQETDVEWQRFLVGESLASYVSGVIETDQDAVNELSRARILIDEAERFVRMLSLTLSGDCNRADTTLAAYRTTVDTSLARIAVARDSVLSQRLLLSTKRNVRDTADADLQLVLQGSRAEVIAAQEKVVDQAEFAYEQQLAIVDQAQASVQQAYARSQKTVVRSPIGGVVSKHNVRVGEFVSSAQTIMRITADAGFEIEVFVPELDVVEIKPGFKTRIMLDAYRGEVFEGTVVRIEDGETVIEGVPTYKTVIYFDTADERIGSGMTADVEILVDQRENVLRLPVRAVKKEGDRSYIELFEEEQVKQVDVEVGLKSSDGFVEIVGGVDEGVEVILFTK